MSDLIVKVVQISDIQPHPNADALELAIVGGWQVVVKKGTLEKGDHVIHIPPDSLVPWDIAEKWGVSSYLSGYEKYKLNSKNVGEGRVKTIRLRGEISHGFIVENKDNHPADADVKDFYGIMKWEPPEDVAWSRENAEKPHPGLFKYTDIQNQRNYQSTFYDGEEVVATEKIHGTSSVIALVTIQDNDEQSSEFMISSKKVRRKIGEGSLYELPLNSHPFIKNMLEDLYVKNTINSVRPVSVEIFGELFGWVQDLKYGHNAGDVSYRAFDIAINGKYVDYDVFTKTCDEYDIPRVPEIYRGKYDEKKLWELSLGNTLIKMDNPHIREGLVVHPVKERIDPKLGRVILKFISNTYLTRKGGTEFN